MRHIAAKDALAESNRLTHRPGVQAMLSCGPPGRPSTPRMAGGRPRPPAAIRAGFGTAAGLDARHQEQHRAARAHLGRRPAARASRRAPVGGHPPLHRAEHQRCAAFLAAGYASRTREATRRCGQAGTAVISPTIARWTGVAAGRDGVRVADPAVLAVDPDLSPTLVPHDLTGPGHGGLLGFLVSAHLPRPRPLHVPAALGVGNHVPAASLRQAPPPLDPRSPATVHPQVSPVRMRPHTPWWTNAP